ncbi:hypothetical protein HMN09_00137100 [Mycena chlorophos]|uniref:Uncharacterized protein n=1 Tax=Mycena chlorophos TaxID=658473 RepID=A0A8H6WJ58_MYCCL|nr:hypothetical protein HMN09_00137100 [Mycena chlorophos]
MVLVEEGVRTTTTGTFPPASDTIQWEQISRAWAEIGPLTPRALPITPEPYPQTVVMVYEREPTPAIFELATLPGKLTTTTTRQETVTSTTTTLVGTTPTTTHSLSGTTGANSSDSGLGFPGPTFPAVPVSALQTSHAIPSGTASSSPSASNPASTGTPAKSIPNTTHRQARAALIGGALAASLVLTSLLLILGIWLWRRHRRRQALLASSWDDLEARPTLQVARNSVEPRAPAPSELMVDASEELGTAASRLSVTSAAAGGTPAEKAPQLIPPEPQALDFVVGQIVSAAETQSPPADSNADAASTSSGSESEPQPINHRQFRALIHRVQELEAQARAARAETEMPVEPPPRYT